VSQSADLFGDAPNYQNDRFPSPRPFQITAHQALREGVAAGHKNQMVMAPTGAGKLYLGLRVAFEALKKGKKAVFVCDRTTLIDQASKKADEYGLGAHSIMQSNHWRYNPSLPFQIASAQTIQNRQWPDADVIIIDEAHTQLKVWTEHIQKTRAWVVGLSATPFSPGLGKLFTNLVCATTMDELTRLGTLVPMIPYTCKPVDMTGAATSGGEWTDEAAEERGMAIVGDVVSEWIKLAEGRKTIVFGSTIKHCEELCRQFSAVGVMAAVFTAHTSPGERDALLREYRKPDSTLRVLISVEALAKGFDVQDVGCVVDCRPLRKSLSTAIQMWGRGLRASEETGKRDMILLDHTGNILRFAEDYTNIYFHGLDALDMGEKLDKKIRREEEEKKAIACPVCGFKPFVKRCMSCGHEKQAQAMIETLPGQMEAVMLGKKKLADDKRHLYEQCCTYARAHSAPDKQRGRAGHLFKAMAGDWPPRNWSFESTPDVVITRNVLNKIRSLNIAHARGAARAV
jgi:DNA repair protein RadD